MSANKLMAGLIVLIIVSAMIGILYGAALHVHETVPILPAKFKVGDCFRSTPPLHRWEPADGMVMNLDATAYLVVYALSMKSRKPIDPAYVGSTVAIEAFDRGNELVGCPAKW